MSKYFDFYLEAPLPTRFPHIMPSDNLSLKSEPRTSVSITETANASLTTSSDMSKLAAYQPWIPENHFLGWLTHRMMSDDIVLKFAYKDCRYLSEFIDGETILNDWNSKTPIFISAQTGTGKTTFIYDVLIKELIVDTNKKDDKVLLLCNRVALSRQCKYKAAKWQKDFQKDGSYEKRINNKSIHDIDSEYHDFGAIHIYTYHQIYQLLKDKKSNENNRFSLSNYKYIVFDECHFFTSDSRFVNTTDDMLKMILAEGNESIRIYMSATPEVVFEPIIRMEYALINDIKSDYIKDVKRIFSDCREGLPLTAKMIQLLGWDVIKGTMERLQMTSETYLDLIEEDNAPTSKHGIHLNPSNDLDELQLWEDTYCNQIKLEYRLNIFFYYMERNYDYIQDIKTYKDINDLYSEIDATESPKNKWLTFVPSRRFGKKLRDKLNGVPSDSDNNDNTDTDIEDELSARTDDDNESLEEGQSTGKAIFISAKNRNTELPAKETYNDIVRDEHFEQNILITTSVLDNGINIKDNNIRNIAIGIYDRVEFLQMLGRLRIENKDCKINLYTQEYDVDKLKKYVDNAARNLIYRLMIDSYGSEEKKEMYKFIERRKTYNLDRDLYRFSDDSDVFCEYNRCSIYQIIDYLSNLIIIIRKTEDDFCVHFKNDDEELLRGKIVKYYTQGNGRNAEWSSSIVDILGSKDDMENRNKAEYDALCHGIVSPQYQYTLQDTFIHYLYYDVIPCYINEQIKNKIEKYYFNTLPSEKRNDKNSVKESNYVRFAALCKRHKLAKPDSICPYFGAWKEMYEDFSVDIQKWYASLMGNLDKLAERIDQYRKLASDVVTNPTDAQYLWIGLLKTTEEKDVVLNLPNIEDWIRNANVPTLEELEEVKKSRYYDEDFLKKHSGIPKGKDNPTRQETEFIRKYLDGKPLKAYRGRTWNVDGEEYEFTSRSSTGSRTTYYLFVKKTANHIQQMENCDSPDNVS